MRRPMGLAGGFALALSLVLPPAAQAASPFPYGVTAGEPTASSIRLWTRYRPGGPVTLQVSRRRDFASHRNFLLFARRKDDFTVQRRVAGLRPGTRYFFRFAALGIRSTRGTFVTAPPAGQDRDVRFGWTGDYDATPTAKLRRPFWGDFRLFDAMREERNDFNIALGDTIYADSEAPGTRRFARGVKAKWVKYRQTMRQRPLRLIRGSAGYYSHWDDHEFINDYSKRTRGRALYEATLRAFRDYSPVSFSRRDGLYRRRRWGANLELFFLDQRSFRSAPAWFGGDCENPQSGRRDRAPTANLSVRGLFSEFDPPLAQPVSPGCMDRIHATGRTILGRRQLERLKRALVSSTARFKVIVNEVPIQQFYVNPYDRWEGYGAEREELLRFLRENVKNVVFITTDIHSTFINDVRLRTFEDPGPMDSGIMEVSIGPANSETFREELDDRTHRGAARFIDRTFFEPSVADGGLGMRCSGIEQFSYGQVEVGPTRLTITPKGIDGGPLVTDDGVCPPIALDYEP
jgi:alkaline phosphatase D